MSNCCDQNDNRLKINLGNFTSIKSLKKTLWSIAEFLGDDKPEIILTTNINDEEILNTCELFITRINFTLIKTKNIKLSDEKAYELCNSFSNEKTLVLSANSIFYQKPILENEISFQSFLLPKYVQEGVETYGQNMCDFYAKECFKYPLTNNFYFKKPSDQFSETKIFCVEEDLDTDSVYTSMSIEEILNNSEIIRK